MSANITTGFGSFEGPNTPAERRLSKELMDLVTNPPPGIRVDTQSIGAELHVWLIHLIGPEGTLYAGEDLTLQFKFGSKYPFDSPQVTFLEPNIIPVHPNVYSDGRLCLPILTDDWSPALNVASVCLNIMSMLSSCNEKRLPPDNALYIKTFSKPSKNTKMWYHDFHNLIF